MSSFYRQTKNPRTGRFENAEWVDDYFGEHRYGVVFSDGVVTDPEKIKIVYKDDDGKIKETK